MLDPRQGRQVRRVHRNHGGNRGNKEGTLRHGPPLIREIIRKAMRIPQFDSNDRTAKGKV
jgi:hypothetical protein